MCSTIHDWRVNKGYNCGSNGQDLFCVRHYHIYQTATSKLTYAITIVQSSASNTRTIFKRVYKRRASVTVMAIKKAMLMPDSIAILEDNSERNFTIDGGN